MFDIYVPRQKKVGYRCAFVDAELFYKYYRPRRARLGSQKMYGRNYQSPTRTRAWGWVRSALRAEE